MKTRKDLLRAVLERIGGKSMVIEFEAVIAPQLKWKGDADAPISEEEYDKLLKEMKKESPGIVNWLLKGAHNPSPKVEAKVKRMKDTHKRN